VKDSLNAWFVVFGAKEKPLNHQVVNSDYKGKGASCSLTYDVQIKGNGTTVLNFVIAGSYTSKEDAVHTYLDIQNNLRSAFKEKQERYRQLALKSKLTIPDKKLEETFEWLKYNSDWMIRTVPEIGTGIAAGIPDYPWWFGVDSEYALKGYMAIGRDQIVYQTIKLLDSLSSAVNGNGRIIHETSTNGAVFNKGNINETPQFASLIWEVYQWNGEIEFLERYFPTIKKGLDWLLTQNDPDKNLFPNGFGMMEIHGLDSEMIDVAVYSQRAFEDAAKIARELGEDALSASYKKTAALLREKINDEFWSEEFNSYADFIGTDEQAIKLVDDAIVRADTLNKPWAVTELKETRNYILSNPSKASRPFVLHHNWVVNTPMEMKVADEDKAIKALKTAEKFVNPFGVFVTGIDRDESAGSDDGSFKGSEVFSYTGAVMTLPTGVQAVAENNYGRPNEALKYLKKMSRTFSYALPGSMYEVSPDYGMIAQAWNIYGFAIPIVQQFFGISPQASKKKVLINPHMPDEWNDASLENVIIADNKVSVFYSNSDGLLKLKVIQQNADWAVEIGLPDNHETGKYKVLKSSVEPVKQENRFVFSSKKKTTEIVLQLSRQ
jgi:glycogen debranching enzyme